MEVIRGTLHTAIPMGDPSRVGEARRHAAQLAADCGLDDVNAGRLAIVVTELATNLVRHARNGRLLLSGRAARREVEVLAIDEGPGMPDLERSMADGWSSASTPGTGLGAVRRLSQAFDIHTDVPRGTVVVARVGAQLQPAAARQRSCAAAISLAAPGETVCGDAWVFALDGHRAAVMVADGLGHGPDAAAASREAVDVFTEDPMAAPKVLLERVHARLRSTRGAAVTLLQADLDAGSVRTAGAGNVIGRIVSGVTDKTLVGQHGTAGITIRSPDEMRADWPSHAVLVVFSDGIESRWKPELLHPVLGRDPAVCAAVLLRDHMRGRDDATVAVLRRKD